MLHLERHKLIAIGIYFAVVGLEWMNAGQENAIAAAVVLGMTLCLIIFSGLFAFLGSFGFMESFASDSRDGLSSDATSIIGWVIFIIACIFFVFSLNIY